MFVRGFSEAALDRTVGVPSAHRARLAASHADEVQRQAVSVCGIMTVTFCEGALMLDSLIAIFAHLLSWMFLIGGIGCILVIPIVACRLFAVIFEPDTEADI